jgi:EAL domain-containing protein (putative c-di-GMP-specific phosphodiesterase class I)
MLCRRIGTEVRTCASLEELEALLPDFQPDILLVDLMMPGRDGIDVLCRIGTDLRAATYIMTGADRRTIEATFEVLHASRIEVADILRKPISLSHLRDLVEAPSRARPAAADHSPARPASRGVLPPAQFERAVRERRIGPFFQPIFAADGVTLKGFEALARIEGEDKSLFAAEHLHQLVEDDSLATALTDLVIDRALGFLSRLDSPRELKMSINIFGNHAVADGFRESLVEKCARHGLAPERVILELSEAAVFDLDESDLRKITQLRLAGFGLSIDDFGTGNSSLGRLASLPFSELKIDKSFCLKLPSSRTAWAVVETCLGLARRLEMNVTAEGVETQPVALALAQIGCDALQGHYFGHAMSGEDAAHWIARGCPKAAA